MTVCIPHPTIAVDPGCGGSARSGTGIVAVAESRPVGATVIVRPRKDHPVTGWEHHRFRKGRGHSEWWYEPLHLFVRRVGDAVQHMADVIPAPKPWRIAVETFNSPSGFVSGKPSSVDPWGGYGAIAVCHGVIQRFWAAEPIPVEPGRHGSRHVDAGLDVGLVYPAEIVGGNSVPVDGLPAKGACDHLRSAYDIAWMAHGLHAPTPQDLDRRTA